MDYIELFRPIFSFGAHAILADTAGEYGISEAKTALAGLDLLIAEAFSRRGPINSQSFDAAWFPVNAWLEEKLSPLRARIEGEAPNTGAFGCDFFLRLDHLLEDQAPCPNGESDGILEVYRTCLELGFRGRYNLPADLPELDTYVRRCRKAGTGNAAKAAFNAYDPNPDIKPKKRNGMAMFWSIPLAVTLGLFLLYRLLLTDLYRQIIG